VTSFSSTLDRICRAGTVETVDAILTQAIKYESASAKTKRRWEKAAERQKRFLETKE
jgi:hypothetical protein